MRRALPLLLLTLLVGCGEDGAPSVPATLALAPEYVGVVVTKLSNDGVGVDGLTAFDIELFGLQSAGGRVAGSMRRTGGTAYDVEGTFDAESGDFRFEAFEGSLTSTRTERVDAVGGRADDDFPRDGIGNVLTGYVRTSSATRFESDGDLLAVARADDLPSLDGSKVTATEVELGKVIVRADPGFTEGAMGVEIFLFGRLTEQAEFRLAQAPVTGALADTAMSGLDGDIVVLRAVRAGRRGPPVWLRVRQ